MISLQKPASRATEKRTKQLAMDKAQREVYRAVDVREGFCCRVCSTRVNPQGLTLLERGHHHHIVYRSKSGSTSSDNVVLLCSSCHADVHAARLFISGDADKKLNIERAKKVRR